MTLTSEVMERITVEATNGVAGPEDEGAEEKAFRAKMEDTIGRLAGEGAYVQITPEMPDTSDFGILERKEGPVTTEEAQKWNINGPW